MIKNHKNLILLLFIFAATLVLYTVFINTPYFQALKDWSKQHFWLFFLFLAFFKALAIVWPPIHGTILTLGSIPIIGWERAYLADLTGNMIGSSIAYFIGKKYGYLLLYKIFDKKAIDRLKKIKIISSRQIEAIFVLRVLTGSTMIEVVCYGAGLMKIDFRSFMIGSLLSHIALGIPFFVITGNAIEGKNIMLNVLIAVLAIPIFWKLKNRYFAYESAVKV